MYSGVVVWDVDDGTIRGVLPVDSVRFTLAVGFPSDEAASCIAVDRRGLFYFWNGRDEIARQAIVGEKIRELDPDRRPPDPFSLALSPDGARAVVVNAEEQRLWEVDLATMQMRERPLPDLPPVTAVAWISEEELLVGSGKSGSIHILNRTEPELWVLQSFAGPLSENGRLTVSPDGQYACIVSGTSEASSLVNMQQGDDSAVLQFRAPRTAAVTFSTDSHYFYWCDDHGAVHVYELHVQREVRCYRQHRSLLLGIMHMSPHDIGGVAIRPDGRVAMSTTRSGTVRLWQLDHE